MEKFQATQAMIQIMKLLVHPVQMDDIYRHLDHVKDMHPLLDQMERNAVYYARGETFLDILENEAKKTITSWIDGTKDPNDRLVIWRFYCPNAAVVRILNYDRTEEGLTFEPDGDMVDVVLIQPTMTETDLGSIVQTWFDHKARLK